MFNEYYLGNMLQVHPLCRASAREKTSKEPVQVRGYIKSEGDECTPNCGTRDEVIFFHRTELRNVVC